MDIAVIGAGAAGCFSAINIKRLLPEANVVVYEGGSKALAKVSITGGGRCNLTNSFKNVNSLGTVYPRGERLMKRLLKEFGSANVYQWFEEEGVRLMTQPDQRVFPISGESSEIVQLLLRLMNRLGIKIMLRRKVKLLRKVEDHFIMSFCGDNEKPVKADKAIVTIGGCSRMEQLSMLKSFHLEIIPPVPSLFSFCIPDNDITRLMGISVENVSVALCGTKFKSDGDLLITHWGVSGPAVLKLSSYAARHLADCNYKTLLSVNWLGQYNEQEACNLLVELTASAQLRQLQNVYPLQLNTRLWEYLLFKAGLNPAMRWKDLGKKGRNRLASLLINDVYQISGKNKFKDEFVTCGGIGLSCINPKTLECRSCDGLYFAGEVLDVDAVTGGFNLQAAWTMGYVVAQSVFSTNPLNLSTVE